ncbi:hypothetical protein GCM10007415_00100 [Parapedobacter pyrenivorans]|uniref:Uncharacterized protein n=1 Tax=Parapedobacter pyrenivorans TaxID=1305674 RepID=A0A917HAN6_9SPHI|nr:hypothetical protein [Parapedobacter pyrenivorans]GGG72784.1 hypothetical protein GCM10007415_00100 [Parapedobacter pyrenivorans]
MELIIDIDNIKDTPKKEWLLNTLKLMGINFHTVEKRQTLEEYNQDLEAGDTEIEKGEYITAIDLKAQIKKW